MKTDERSHVFKAEKADSLHSIGEKGCRRSSEQDVAIEKKFGDGSQVPADLVEGDIPRLLVKFSTPAIVGMIAQSLYMFIDRVCVGQKLGHDGIAGITFAFPYMLIQAAFGMLLGLGAAALVSLRLGEKRKDEAERVLGNAFTLIVVVSCIQSALGVYFAEPLLRFFQASNEALPYAKDYLQIIALGAIFQTMSFGFAAVIRAEGNPFVAMMTMLISVVANAVFAPLFLFGFNWGMKGAALATVLAEGVSTIWVIWHFTFGPSTVRIHARTLRPRWATCRSIVLIGSPHFAMQLAAAAFTGILNSQLQFYGHDVAVSAMGVLYVVIMLAEMPIFGINQGMQPIVGFNYGAKRFDRVKQTLMTASLAATCLAIAGFVVAMCFPEQVIRLFDRNSDHELIAVGTQGMQIGMLMFPFVGFQIIIASYFQAVGKPFQSMFLLLSRQVLCLIPAALLLPRFFGLAGVWASMPAADCCSAMLTTVCMAFELRKLQERHDGQTAVESLST